MNRLASLLFLSVAVVEKQPLLRSMLSAEIVQIFNVNSLRMNARLLAAKSTCFFEKLFKCKLRQKRGRVLIGTAMNGKKVFSSSIIQN